MPNSKTHLAIFATLLIGLGALVKAVVTPHPPMATPESALAKLSPEINIDIYVDGSGSMRNFLKPARNEARTKNPLLEFLSACENELSNPPATGGWRHGPVGYWRFGADVTPLPKGDLRILANNPDGYHVHDKQVAGFQESRTSIEIPVNTDPQKASSAKVPELKIIVTDLYQTYGTNSKPADALANKYLTDAGAVAIYGIRNPYSGPVEDLPALQGKSLPAGAADTMPFYIIIAGDKAADVFHAQEVLMAANTIGPILKKAFSDKQAFAMYFSKDPGWRAFAPNEMQGASVAVDWRDPESKKRIGIGPGLQERFEGSLALLRIRQGKARVRFSAPEPVTVAREGETSIADVRPEVSTLAYVKRSTGAGKPVIQEEDKRAEQAVKAHICPGSNDVCATFDYGRLHSYKGTYLFRFDIVAAKKANVTGVSSEEMRNWNVEDAEERQIAADKTKPGFPFLAGASGTHPGRTPNLSGILTALQNRVFEVKDPTVDPVRLATYELYVEAK